ncbi:MAG TPA: prepilin-type N-terminal cleavage/methylation domain-containing protein [Methylococcaceae bacterium]|nr:prepilin-type N-terminal cleavage/methylation domain-containing protein [Methylococcaceae bacterium]
MNKSGANQKGFTLIEVLIAMTLFTIMMTLAFNAFSLGNKSWASMSSRSQRMNLIDIVYRFIDQNLSTVGGLSVEDLPSDSAQFSGTEDGFTFIGQLKHNPDRKGWHEFTLAFNANVGALTVSLRPFYPRINVHDLPSETVVLVDDITDVTVHYATGADSETKSIWRDQWQTESLPKGVKLQLASKDGRYWPEWVFAIKIDDSRADRLTDNLTAVMDL